MGVLENGEVYASAAQMAEARREKLEAVTEMRTMRRKCASSARAERLLNSQFNSYSVVFLLQLSAFPRHCNWRAPFTQRPVDLGLYHFHFVR